MAISSIVSSSIGAIDAYTAQSHGSDSQAASTQQSQQSSSITKLSAAGVLKSSLEDVQVKAQVLKNVSNSSSDLQEFKGAVQGVVGSINTFRQSIAAAEVDQNTRPAFSNVERAVFGDNNQTASALQKSGLDRQDNGTLTIDQNKLDNTLQNNRQGTLDAFSQLAARVENAAARQTQVQGSSNSNQTINNSTENQTPPSDRTSDEARLNAQKLAQQLASQQALASGYTAHNAVASYFTVNSL